ncbi:MAG: homoserine dehydrogenase [Anaerovoracaceae bacterium]|nr:homoserine dehydrogenase [Clostridiales bacterium]
MADYNIGLLGLGTIGFGTYQVLEMNRREIEEAVGKTVEISKILEKDQDKKREIEVPKEKFTLNPDEIFDDPSITVVIELLGGIEPATAFMIKAMEKGKSVVTANKAAVAANFNLLSETARKNNVKFCYEAGVAGGIPILKVIKTVLRANRFTEILGIVNGTTNYILTKMSEENMSYEEALKKAQELGFAEKDPTADVMGLDSANKLTILTKLCFKEYVHPDNIPTTGISHITKAHIEEARNNNMGIKLLAKASLNSDGKVSLEVAPIALPLSHPLMSVKNEFNAIYLTGNAVGELMFYGKGAGALPTGSAVMGDVIDILSS